MKQSILFILLFLFSLSAWGQRSETKLREYPIPKNINQCLELLDKTMPNHEIQLIKALQEDSIYHHVEFVYTAPKYGADFFHAWNLSIGSRLTKYFKRRGLDLSKNTSLTILDCVYNKLTSSALNALFETLHSNAGEKIISILGNPGDKDCDRSIAERKGWTVQ